MNARRGVVFGLGLCALALTACTTVPERSGLLSDYSRQAAFDGRLSKRAAARPETAPPTDSPLLIQTVVYAPGVETASGLSEPALDLVLNRFARGLCQALADRFVVGDAPEGAYRLRAFITEVRPTNRLAAAVSMPMAYLSPVGGRLPIGLGALSAEVELVGPDGTQVASMTWRRAANASDGASVSAMGDAYALAGEAAESFGQVMDGGDSALTRVPVAGLIGNIARGPEAECARYGSNPGLLASAVQAFGLGLPPGWVDRGAARDGVTSVTGPAWVDARPSPGEAAPGPGPVPPN